MDRVIEIHKKETIMNSLCLLSLMLLIPAGSLLAADDQALIDRAFSAMEADYYFQAYDEDGDGRFNAEERTWLTQRLLRDFDFNGNGHLEADELLAGQCFMSPRLPFDDNKNGRLEKREREKLMAALLRCGDADQDGKLSSAEWRDGAEVLLLFSRSWFSGSRTEWQARFDHIVEDYGVLHEGRLDVVKLKREIAIASTLQALRSDWPDYDRNHNQNIDPDEREPMRAALQGILDLDGDGTVTVEEAEEVTWRFVFTYQRHPEAPVEERRQWLAKEARQAFDARYLPDYDLNHNGRWEADEQRIASGSEWVLEVQFHSHPQFDLDHNQKMDRQERQAVLAWMIKTYGVGNADGTTDWRQIADDHCKDLDTLLADTPANGREQRRAELLAVFDFNHNGTLEPAEALAATGNPYFLRGWKDDAKKQGLQLAYQKTLLAWYDKNQDGTLDMPEARRLCRQEPMWPGLRQDNPEFDLEKKGFLNAEERTAFVHTNLKLYDLNSNGRLECGELQEKQTCERYDVAATRGLLNFGELLFDRQTPRDPVSKKVTRKSALTLALQLADFDGDGWLDSEEKEILGKMGNFVLQLSRETVPGRKPEITVTGKLEPAQIKDLLWKHLSRYDANRNGRLDLDEMRTGIGIEMNLLALLSPQSEATARELDPNGDGVVSEEERRAFFASLLPDFDANRNGRIEPEELNEKALYESNLSVTLDGFPKIRPADYRMTAKVRTALLAELVKYYDTNGNGKIDPAELKEKLLRDSALLRVAPLFPGFENLEFNHPDSQLRALEKLLLKDYDRDHNGRIDTAEADLITQELSYKAMVAKNEQSKKKIQQQQERRDAEWLKKYDFNGNGKLDPEERTRAEADAKAGIQAPARDE
jgi:Ca2+-binding EF-hand superfamily protein